MIVEFGEQVYFSPIWLGQSSWQWKYFEFLTVCFLLRDEVSPVLLSLILESNLLHELWADEHLHHSGERNTLLHKHQCHLVCGLLLHLGRNSAFLEVRGLRIYTKQASLIPNLSIFWLSSIIAVNHLANFSALWLRLITMISFQCLGLDLIWVKQIWHSFSNVPILHFERLFFC